MPRFVNFDDLFDWMGEVDDVDKALSFLMGERLLPSSIKCPYCQTVLYPKKRTQQKTYPSFQCQRTFHSFKQSILTGTMFEGTRLYLRQIMNLGLCFSLRMSYQVAQVCSSFNDEVISHRSIADWYNFCREICLEGMMRRKIAAGKIGGAGRIIQIDECNISRRKNEQGHNTDEKWILGMIDKETKDFRLEICPGNKRDADTLFELIDKNVDQASTVYTDSWKGYKGLMDRGFAQHITVKHHADSSVNMNDMNTIRSQFRPIIQRLNRGGIRHENLALHLDEHIWMQDCKKRNVEPFVQLIDDIRHKYSFE